MRFWKTVSELSKSLIAFAWLMALGFPTQAAEVTDMTGTRVSVPDHPSRIVALAPSLAELASELLDQDHKRIVGVTEYADFPAGLKKIPSVGPYHRFNLEKVASLKPDLVLATVDGNAKDQVERLRRLKIPVVVVSTLSMKEVISSIRLVASAMGRSDDGNKLAGKLESAVRELKKSSEGSPRKRVLLQLSGDPLIVVGKRSFLHEALEIVGGENIYADARSNYPRPSIEDAIHRDPDVIVILALGGDEASFRKIAADWKKHPGMKAVKSGSIHIVHSDPLMRPSSRLIEGLSRLRQAVHANR